MVAAYPPRIETQPTKRDFDDPIWARHFNVMQEEVRAVEQTLGVNPHIATRDPAGRTPDYGTVAERVKSAARGEPMCAYRGFAVGVQVAPNALVRPVLQTSQDTHGGATSVGYRLPETGYWVIVAKADWKPTAASAAHPTIRALGIELNSADFGLTDSVIETTANRDDMTTHVMWQERLRAGTDISINLRAATGDPGKNPLPANVYLRVYLVRCMAEGEIRGLPVGPFQPEPDPPTPPPGPRPVPTQPIPPSPPPPKPRYLSIAYQRFDGGYNVFYNDGSFAGVEYRTGDQLSTRTRF